MIADGDSGYKTKSYLKVLASFPSLWREIVTAGKKRLMLNHNLLYTFMIRFDHIKKNGQVWPFLFFKEKTDY